MIVLPPWLDAASAEPVGEGPRAWVRSVGRALGASLHAGDTVLLLGGLGAGKTFFTRGVADGMALPGAERIVSPTFALVVQHPGPVPLSHADLYRLSERAELDSLGLDEVGAESVLVVEWPDRLPGPPSGPWIALTLRRTQPLRRAIEIAGGNARALAEAVRQGARNPYGRRARGLRGNYPHRQSHER